MTAAPNTLAAQLADDIEGIGRGAAPARPSSASSTASAPVVESVVAEVSGSAPEGESAVAQAPARPARFGKVVPTKAGQVAQPMEIFRIRRVNPLTFKLEMVNDFTTGDIVAGGGDLEAFIRTNLAPVHGGGTYNVVKLDKGFELTYGSYTIADPRPGTNGAPLAPSSLQPGPAAAAAPPPSLDQLAALQERVRAQDQQVARAAEQRARDEEERRRKEKEEQKAELLALLGPKKDQQAPNPMMDFLVLSKLMKDDTPREDPKIAQLVEAVIDLRGQVQQVQTMAMSAPPPMPPMGPPPPSTTEVVTGVIAAVTPLVSGVLAAWQANTAAAEARAEALAAAQAASAMTPEKAMTLATMALGIAEKMGLIGKKDEDPLKLALAERIMNEINAEPVDPLEGITRMLDLVEKIRPKPETAQTLMAVLDKTIDKLPNILNAAAGYVEKRMHVGDGAAAHATPDIFIRMRDAVFQIDANHKGQERDNAIVHVVITALREVAALGVEWAPLVMRLRDAIIAEDVEAFRRAWAETVGKAWPTQSPERKRFFDIVLGVLRQHSRPVSNWMRQQLKRPSREEELGLVPRGAAPAQAQAQAQAQTVSTADLLEEDEAAEAGDGEATAAEPNTDDLLDPPEE